MKAPLSRAAKVDEPAIAARRARQRERAGTITDEARDHPDQSPDAAQDRDHAAPRGSHGSTWQPDQFRALALRRLRTAARDSPVELVADRVCAAAADLLDIDGASLAGLYSPSMSVPVGASDPMARAGEQAQFTAGEGPCVHALHTGAVGLVADVVDVEDDGRRHWPTFCLLLARSTDYRSVIALPVRLTTPAGAARAAAVRAAGGGTAALGDASLEPPLALSCYRRPSLVTVGATIAEAAVSLGAALRAALELGAAMGVALGEVGLAGAGSAPAWLDSRTALVRAVVWQAEEVLLQADEGLDRETALAALRTYAVIHVMTVDETASMLLRGRLGALEVLGRP